MMTKYLSLSAILSYLTYSGMVIADTCALTAAMTGDSIMNLGGTTSSSSSGWFLSINGGEEIQIHPDTGNEWPLKYHCASDPGNGDIYGMAYFSKTPKGVLGMCVTDCSDATMPGNNFNCEDQAGKKWTGTTDSTFFGFGTSAGSFCTINFDC